MKIKLLFTASSLFLYVCSMGQWAQTLIPNIAVSVSELAISGSSFLVGTNGGDVNISEGDSCCSWSEINTGLSNLSITSVLPVGTDIFVSTAGGGVFRSTDNGAS